MQFCQMHAWLSTTLLGGIGKSFHLEEHLSYWRYYWSHVFLSIFVDWCILDWDVFTWLVLALPYAALSGVPAQVQR